MVSGSAGDRARVATEIDENLGICLVGIAEGWRFPAPKNGQATAVRVPIELTPP